MANPKMKTLTILGEYFKKKGKILSISEYQAQNDAPVRVQIVKRTFNSWARMVSMLNYNLPETVAAINKPKAAPKKTVAKATKKKGD